LEKAVGRAAAVFYRQPHRRVRLPVVSRLRCCVTRSRMERTPARLAWPPTWSQPPVVPLHRVLIKDPASE